MPRPIKQGLDYYPIDVNFLQDIKVRKIIRACGTSSPTILISLLSNIYKDYGYFVVWDSDLPFLIADEVGVSEGAVCEVIKKALQVEFFNQEYYTKYKILTSKGILKRFIKATEKRKQVDILEEYCLIARSELLKAHVNLINVDINSINACNNKQSKEKESKVKKSKNIPLNPPKGEVDKNAELKEIWFKYSLSPKLSETVKDFIKYKQERKEYYKPMGLNSLLKQITNSAKVHGEDTMIDLIDKSMANNYKGIAFKMLEDKREVNNGNHRQRTNMGTKESTGNGTSSKSKWGNIGTTA